MKKLLLIVATVAIAVAAQAQAFRSTSFLGGNLSVFLTNNSTTTYGDTLVGYTNASGSAVYSGTSQYSTNGFQSPGTYQTNANVSYGNAWFDVPTWSDANGNAAAGGIFVSYVGTASTCTNTVTFTFVALGTQDSTGTPQLACTQADRQFSFAIVGNGTTAVNCLTNLPTALMQSSAGFRLKTVVTALNGTNVSSDYFLKACTLNGFK